MPSAMGPRASASRAAGAQSRPEGEVGLEASLPHLALGRTPPRGRPPRPLPPRVGKARASRGEAVDPRPAGERPRREVPARRPELKVEERRAPAPRLSVGEPVRGGRSGGDREAGAAGEPMAAGATEELPTGPEVSRTREGWWGERPCEPSPPVRERAAAPRWCSSCPARPASVLGAACPRAR